MKIKAIGFILLTMFFGNIFAQDSAGLSLQEAQAYASKHSYDLHNAQLDVEAAAKEVMENTGIGLPHVNVVGQFQNYLDVPTMVLPASDFNPQAPEGQMMAFKFGINYNTNLTLQATQMIFNGEYFVGLRASRTYKMLSEKKYKKTEIDVKNEVAQAYYTVLMAKENLRILDSTVANTNNIYQQTQQIYKQGLMEKQDVQQLQLNVMSLKNMQENAQKQLILTKKLLKLQMGMNIDSSISLSDDFNSILNENQAGSVLDEKFNPENNINYDIMNTNVQLQKLLLSKNKTSFLPTINAAYNYQKSQQSNDFEVFKSGIPWYTTSFWAIQINLPIFNGGTKAAEVSQARIALDQAETSQEKIKQGLIIQYQKAEADYITANDQLGNKKESMQLAKSIYGKTLEKYKQGTNSSLELSQAQNQYLKAQGGYIQAIYELLNAKNTLNKLLSK